MLKGKWIYVAVAASLGMMATLYSFHPMVLVLIGAYFGWQITKQSNIKLLIICACVIVFFTVYFKWVEVNNYSRLTGEEAYFAGEITSNPKIDGNQLSFIFKLPTKERLQVFYKIKSKTELNYLQTIKVGMSCQFKGELSKPSVARNFYAFDYKKFLYYKRIHWIVTPNFINSSECIPSTSSKYLLQRWRANQLTYIKDHFPKENVGIMQALIFGEQNEIDITVAENFQRFGIIHLLVISGSHVALIILSAFYIMIRMGLTRENSFLLIFILLPVYMILAGATPSVVRACVVPMVVLLSVKFKSKLVPVDALSIAFLLMITFNPYYLTDIGFQLSFLVSLALLLSTTTILGLYENRVKQLMAVTTIAQICSLPIMFYYFYEVSLLSLPFNIVFVPLMSVVILPLSFFSYFGHVFFEPLGTIFTIILSNIIHYSFLTLEWVEQFPVFTISVGKPPIWLMVTYYVVIIYLLICWEKFKQFLRLGKPLFLLFLVLLYHWCSPFLSNEGNITMIDVGQGDCFLVELPYRKAVYLIDTGGKALFDQDDWEIRQHIFEVGEDVIVPFLKAKGIRTIDKLILTHGDNDHIGGTIGIIDHIKVKEAVIGVGKIEAETEKQIYHAIQEKNIPITMVQSGDGWSSGDYSFYVLGPNGDEQDKNNRSVVIYTKLGGSRWLFTGDLEEKGEAELLIQFPNLLVDVLKVGHHGSNSSSSESFIEQLKPKYALVSVGEQNRYGHPHKDVIDLFTRDNINIFRTDIHGSVSYKFIQNKGTFEWKIP